MANIFLIALGVQLLCLQHAGASWGSPDSNQYHIQTDEGPERYFRYQTDNGQFRKEKRLQDGTVIGTDAWIDASGYLRQNDYIADNKGYRILKSKTVYVGRDRPIQDAIKVAKNKPADSGILVPSDPSYEPPAQPPPPSSSPLPSPTPSRHRPSSVQPIAFVPSTTAPITLLRHPTPSLNAVFVRPHSEPIASNYLPSAPHTPEHYPSTSPRPPPLDIYVPSTTYAPLTGNELSSAPIALYSPSSTPSPLRDGSEAHLPPLVLYHNGHIEATTYNPRRRKPNPAERRRRPVSPIVISSSSRPYLESTTPASTFSLKQHQQQQQQQQLHLLPTSTRLDSDSNLLDDYNRDLIDSPASRYDRYNSRFSNGGAIRRTDTAESHPYDGVAVTNDGFRYYLPRQYHEERNSASDTRDGSFGYIDPFGIRRVIYYNTDPEQGFVHRKNNRFVGFDATPYDPRPHGA